MKKLLTLLAVALITMPALCSAQDTIKGLNQIRFDGWTDEDWLNNDYIRTLRSYIEACYRGEEGCD